MDKKQKIILTMLELVVEQGVKATPMSQVAKEAKVAVGTIYHYFKNKEEIIDEIYSMICEDFGVIMLANISEDDDFKSQFHGAWLNLYNYFVGNPLAFKFVEYVVALPIISKDVKLKNIMHFESVKELFLIAIRNKEIIDVDLRLLLYTCYGSVISATRLKIRQDLPMSDIQVKQAINMCWNSIRLN